MHAFEAFLAELDGLWQPTATERIVLRVLGSSALMLQSDYSRGTKDGDVLETAQLTQDVKERLLSLGGKETRLHQRHLVYVDTYRRVFLSSARTPSGGPSRRSTRSSRASASRRSTSSRSSCRS